MADLTQLTKIDFFVDPTSTSTNGEILNKALAKLEEMQENADNIADGVYKEFYYGYTYDSRSDLKHYIFPNSAVTEFTLGKNIFMEDEVIPNMDTPSDTPADTPAVDPAAEAATKAFPDLGYEYLTSTPNDIQELINDTVWDSTLTDGTKYKQVQIQIISTATAAQIDNNELSVTFYNDIKEFYPVKTSITPTGSIVDLVPIGLNHENLHFTVNVSTDVTVEAIYVKLWIKNSSNGTVTIDNITTDNHLDVAEQDSMTTVSVSGTATDGAISNGDIVTLTIDAVEYTTTVNNGVWTVVVDINHLKDDTTLVASIKSKDEDGFTSFSTSETHTHTVDIRYGIVTINNINGNNSIDDSIVGMIEVSGTATDGIITDGDAVSMVINGTTYNTTVVSGVWSVDVNVSDLLVDTTFSASVSSNDFANYTIISNSIPHTHQVFSMNVNSRIYVYPTYKSADDYFGSAVATNDTKVVVGVVGEDASATNSGAAYLMNIDGSGLKRLSGYLLAASDFAGSSVDISNNRIVVGVPFDDDDDVGSNSGSALLYDIDGNNPSKIKVSGYEPGAFYGCDVACNDTHIVVGAEGMDGTGAIFIYDIDGNNEIMVKASDAASGDNFGYKVGISNDKIIVGAPNKNSNAGAVYIYDLDGTNEIKRAGFSTVKFGYGVDISKDYFGVAAIAGSKSYIFELSNPQGSPIYTKNGGWNVTMNNSKFMTYNASGTGTCDIYNMSGTLLKSYTGSQSFAQFGFDIAMGEYSIIIGENRYDDSVTNLGRIHIIG